MQTNKSDGGNHDSVVARPIALGDRDACEEGDVFGIDAVHSVITQAFAALSLQTRAFRFDREVANTR